MRSIRPRWFRSRRRGSVISCGWRGPSASDARPADAPIRHRVEPERRHIVHHQRTHVDVAEGGEDHLQIPVKTPPGVRTRVRKPVDPPARARDGCQDHHRGEHLAADNPQRCLDACENRRRQHRPVPFAPEQAACPGGDRLAHPTLRARRLPLGDHRADAHLLRKGISRDLCLARHHESPLELPRHVVVDEDPLHRDAALARVGEPPRRGAREIEIGVREDQGPRRCRQAPA